jgi:hypothetical protein
MRQSHFFHLQGMKLKNELQNLEKANIEREIRVSDLSGKEKKSMSIPLEPTPSISF